MKYLIITFLSCLFLIISSTTTQAAEDKSGVKPQIISLPTGPGSIEGMGEAFEPQLNTGSASYSVKISLPPGVNGHQPELTLQYNSGSGLSPFGIGWDLLLPYIQRQTEKGQPAYQDGDIFVYSNGEELVPLVDGTWRCENESAFMRFKRIGDSWEIRDKSGRIYRLGQYPNEKETWRTSRIGKNPTEFDQTFKWYIDALIDTQGNRIEYFYTIFPDSPGQLYITEIRYNINGNIYNSVTFDYEERPDAFSDYRAGFKIQTGRRAFCIRVLSQGDLVREYRLSYDQDQDEILDPLAEGAVSLAFSLLTRITQFDDSGEYLNYLPPIRFGYTRLHLTDRDNAPFGNFPGSEDIDLNGNGLEDGPGIHQMADAPQNVNFQNGNADFLDVNGDALADIIHTTDGHHYYYLNLGNDSFGPRQSMNNYPGLYLASNGTTMADMDGDGLTDMINKAGSDSLVFYRNQGDGSWAPGVQYGNTPLFDLSNPDTRLMDIDFDKKIDVLQSNSTGWKFHFNKGDGDTDYPPYGNFPGPEDMDRNGNRILNGGAWQSTGSVPMDFPPGVVFSNASVRLADMNGDRMQDVVWIRQLSGTETIVWFWPNKGKREFDNHLVMSGEIALGVISIEDVKLTDINSDGLSDLVKIKSGNVTVWINLGNGQWSEPQVSADTPTYHRSNTALRFADMNGNGTTDLVWIKADPDTPEERFQYIDFCGQTKPNQLKIIDNGLGRRINIQYRSSIDYYVEAREEGNPWQIACPVPMQVVSRVVTTSGLDLDAIPGKDQYTTDFSYRDSYYDGFEKEFRGFTFVKKIERGDESAPTQVTRLFFHTGGPDGVNNDGDADIDERTEKGGAEEEPLKGMILKQEITTSAGGADNCIGDGDLANEAAVFNRTFNEWRIRRVHDPNGGSLGIATMDEREVSFGFNQKQETYLVELESGEPRQTRLIFTYDDFGNPSEEKKFGALSISGDELFTYTEYIYNTDRWIVDKPKRQYQTYPDGTKVSETLSYYDGDAFIGLGLGMVEKGNLIRQEGWVEDEKYIDLVRNAFDPYGNIIGIKDGKGNLREIEYDPVFHTFPVKEIIHVGDEDKDLTITAQYNTGFGTVTQHTDFNGHTTYYEYDSFGRLVKIIKPGDSPEFPTQSFQYTMADPERGLVYAYDEEGNLALKHEISPVSSVKIRTRENFGKPDTFDTIQYVDGLKRKLALVEEAEQGFIFKEAVLFNARGTNRYSFLPYRADSSEHNIPPLSNPKLETYYDAAGREVLKINPPDRDGITTRANTQYLPLQTIVTDENNNPKVLMNDGLDRQIEIHEKNNKETYITRYTYDPLDNLVKIIDAQNNIKTMRYDGIKRKIRENNPDRGVMLYGYDDAGNLIKTTDNKGQIIIYGYDGANRILSEDYLDEAGITSDIKYHYDVSSEDYLDATNVKGALSWVEDLSGAQFFSYDMRGNIAWTVKRIDQGSALCDYRTTMLYDAMDRVVSLTYPDGDFVQYQYNNQSLLESIPDLVNNIDYHASGQIAAFSYANYTETLYSYDPRQRLVQLETKNIAKGNEILQHLSYIMDGVNNITAITDGRSLSQDSPKSATQGFRYDDLYRLIQAEGAGYGIINFQYDRIGNMIWKKSPDPPDQDHIDDPLINLGSMNYGGTGGASNRSGRLPGDPPGPHAITSTESGLEYDYDDNGNMIRHARGDIFSWDFKDQLIRVEKDGTDTKYVYDYGGQRVIKRINDGPEKKTTLYINENYEIREGKEIKYVFAEERRIAYIEGKISNPGGPDQQILTLYPGWNFFSLEIEPEDPAIDVVLDSLEGAFTEVWAFDTQDKEYKGYVPGEGLHDLTEVHAQKGYLIHVTSRTSLVVTGARITNDIPLTAGWNLIGCPTNGSLALKDTLASIDGKFSSVWSYDTLSGKWKHFAPGLPKVLNELEIMEPGKAYWIEMKENGQLPYLNQPTVRVCFYHPDHLGSSNLVMDMEGAVVESTEFYPFGRPRYEKRIGFDSMYKFTGKELDKESGLMYFGARYYDSVVGRFISVDPIQDGLNWYGYANNNPLLYKDMKGLQNEPNIDPEPTGIADVIPDSMDKTSNIMGQSEVKTSSVRDQGRFSFKSLFSDHPLSPFEKKVKELESTISGLYDPSLSFVKQIIGPGKQSISGFKKFDVGKGGPLDEFPGHGNDWNKPCTDSHEKGIEKGAVWMQISPTKDFRIRFYALDFKIAINFNYGKIVGHFPKGFGIDFSFKLPVKIK